MPFDQVMPKFKKGQLKSGGSGKTVTDPKQAVAIMYSEKKKAAAGKTEYQSSKPPAKKPAPKKRNGFASIGAK